MRLKAFRNLQNFLEIFIIFKKDFTNILEVFNVF